jgi:hypothetical protein
MFYACTTHWKRGPKTCRNGLVGRMDAIDAEVLATLETDVLEGRGSSRRRSLWRSTRCGRSAKTTHARR